MAMTAHSSQPPPDDGINSPRTRKNSVAAAPWSQIVRGGDAESVQPMHQHPSPSSSPPASVPEQPTDCASPQPVSNSLATESADGSDGNAGKPKKLAWNKPSNGVAEVVSPVMGAVSWPALSESTKPSPKSSSADSSSLSSKIVSDASTPSSQGPVIAHSPHKQAASNAKSNSSSQNHVPARQKSMKRGGGGSGGGSGGGHSHSNFSQPPPPPPPLPPFPLFAVPPNSYGNLVPAMPDQSPREHTYRANNWEPRLAGGFANDHRHSTRRGNFGRGDGSYHNNFGSRRDQDRGQHGNVRDAHMQPQRASPRGFMPPPNNAAYVPQPVRPFPNPMGFHDLVYVPTLPLESFRGVPMPFIAHAPGPHMLMPVPEPPLPAMLVRQIEYYFSYANLIKDDYLKSNMDDQGWVPITLIAGFNRVKSMTSDVALILDSLRSSTLLEVQDDKVRRRNDWMKWLPNTSRLPTDSGKQSSGSSNDLLTTSFQKISVDDAAANQNSVDNTHHQSHISQEEDTEDKS